MKTSYHKAMGILIAFFVLVFTISFALNRHYPILVIAGESSVGTWMSGALLIISATISLIIGMRQGWLPWLLVSAFFIILALDERFMFHERLKEEIIFSFRPAQLSPWIYELPVISGACVGILMAFLLWQKLGDKSRVLLFCTVILGATSIIIDVLTAGALWEECFKLIAELLMACALLIKVDEHF